MRERLVQFLKEMASDTAYEKRTVKGLFQRNEVAQKLLKELDGYDVVPKVEPEMVNHIPDYILVVLGFVCASEFYLVWDKQSLFDIILNLLLCTYAVLLGIFNLSKDGNK